MAKTHWTDIETKSVLKEISDGATSNIGLNRNQISELLVDGWRNRFEPGNSLFRFGG